MINVYTEEEAKEKMCPQAIHFLGMSPMINCMGGGCMAWRWKNREFICNYKGKDIFADDADDDNKGYCGLGGKP
jgi:hypothetical protein